MSTLQISPPQSFDAERWRQSLAGLTDPDYSGDDNPQAAEHKSASIDLCICLCELFGTSLARETLWERIGSALQTASAKSDDGDCDRLVSLALDHIRAEVGQSGRNVNLAALLYAANGKTLAWRQGWPRYISSHVFSIVTHARMRWETVKQERADVRALKHGGTVPSTGEIVERGEA